MHSPAWSEFLTANLINRIQSAFKRLHRIGYKLISVVISFNDIVKCCLVDLFHNMRKSNHCLHELLSFDTRHSGSLRAREYDFVLVCSSNQHKQSFLVRCIVRATASTGRYC